VRGAPKVSSYVANVIDAHVCMHACMHACINIYIYI